MKKLFQEKVLRTIKKFALINPHDRVIIAVSGGPDSVALLHFLHLLKSRFQICLLAIHINHLIRGDEARQDALFVAELSKNLGVSARILTCDVPALARRKKMSIEDAARLARYTLLKKHARETGATKIATGHTLDDQTETLLMRILRGAGTRGLRGIHLKLDNVLIRPFLEVTREEILEFLGDLKLPYRLDSSNLSLDHTRNRIRNELIPYLEKHFNPALKSALWRMYQVTGDEDELIEELAAHCFPRHTRRISGGIDVFSTGDLPAAIEKRIMRRAVLEVKGNLRDVDYSHIEELIDCMRGRAGRRTIIAGEIVGEKKYHQLSITRKCGFSVGVSPAPAPIPTTGSLFLPHWNIWVSADIYDKGAFEIGEDPLEMWADFERIKFPVSVRTRKRGDRFSPFGMNGEKKLKDFFIELKIERRMRDHLPLLVDGEDRIIWVVGYRTDERFRVNPLTKKVLHLKVEYNNAGTGTK